MAAGWASECWGTCGPFCACGILSLTTRAQYPAPWPNYCMAQVVWLDTVAARARYGRWIGGVLPELVPFPKTGRARGGSKAKGQQQQQQQQQQEQQEQQQEGPSDDSERHWVYLRRLR